MVLTLRSRGLRAAVFAVLGLSLIGCGTAVKTVVKVPVKATGAVVRTVF